MDTRVLPGVAVAVIPIVVLGQVVGSDGAGAPRAAGGPRGTAAATGVIGPDLITAELPSVRRWSTDDTETAYSIATTVCNTGDTAADWAGVPDDRHPVIGQNLYRFSAQQQFEQIGQAWVKHANCALQLPLAGCGACETDFNCLDHLNAGCSDPYTANRNGNQDRLGPKWQVNPYTGVFPLNPAPPYWDQGEGTDGEFRRRIRVLNADIDPALNPGATFFIEGQHVAKDDSAAGNQFNNVSHRPISIDANFNMHFEGGTQREMPAIMAWPALAENVTLQEIDVPADGRLVVGCSYREDGGIWAYEYAIYNMNVERAIGAISIPVGRGAELQQIGFHDVDYHSGDGIGGVDFDGTDWEVTEGAGSISWATDAYAVNESANALRWGTLYNFRFTSDGPPVEATAVLDLFKPGAPAMLAVPLMAPGAVTPTCDADFDGDGDVDFQDLLLLLLEFGPCPLCPQDLDGDSDVDFQDLLLLLTQWGTC
jgi:hypothetical protein